MSTTPARVVCPGCFRTFTTPEEWVEHIEELITDDLP